MADDRFSIWLSMAARDRSIRSRMSPALGRTGYWNRTKGGSRFTGVYFGRGAGVGRVLAHSMRRRGPILGSVVVQTDVVRLKGEAVPSHLRYLARSRDTEGRRPTLYGLESDPPDVTAFTSRCQGDRHQFRTVVSATRACEYEDLRPLVRRLMKQASRDLRTELDWIAVDHYDTANPHTHIVIRGVDDRGGDLIIAREYIYHGFRARALELVELDLGPPDLEQSLARTRRLDILQERATSIDHDLVAAQDDLGRISADHPDRWEQAARRGRLRMLETLGLARFGRDGTWHLEPNLVELLEEIAKRNGIARDRVLDREKQLGIEVRQDGEIVHAVREKEISDRLSSPVWASISEESDPYFRYFQDVKMLGSAVLDHTPQIMDEKWVAHASPWLKERQREKAGRLEREAADPVLELGLDAEPLPLGRSAQLQRENPEWGYVGESLR